MNKEKTKIQSDKIKKGFPVNTYFNENLGKALLQYQKDLCFSSAQDIVRLSVQIFLKKAGYLKNDKHE